MIIVELGVAKKQVKCCEVYFVADITLKENNAQMSHRLKAWGKSLVQ